MPKTEEDVDEEEIEQMAEQEYKRLKRQYRIMENDRINYAEDAKNQLRNQKNTIDRLEFERSELYLEIKAAMAPPNVKKDEALTNQLKALLERRTQHLQSIQREKQEIADLEEQIFKVILEILHGDR